MLNKLFYMTTKSNHDIHKTKKKLIDFQDRSVNSCIKKFIEWVNRNKHILSLKRIWRSKTKYKKNKKY